MSDPCQHPPTRLFTGWANNEEMIDCLWVACCDCGEVLTLDAWPKRTEQIRRERKAAERKMNKATA